MENRVFAAECDGYEYEKVREAVGRTLEAFGGARSLIGAGKRVLVKPNILIPKSPESAATTHPAVIEAVCAAFVEVGADVAVIDSTGAPHKKMFLRLMYGRTGIKKAVKQSGAKLSFDTSATEVNFPQGEILNEFSVLKPVYDADLVISLAKAKTHGFQLMTGCVKNMFGCIPGLAKPRLHRRFQKREDFAKMLVDVCEFIKPGLNILDAIVGMEGQGPASGDPKPTGVILGGISPYAVDVAQCYLMGLKIDNIYTINEAVSRGLSPGSPNDLEWLGDDPKDFRQIYKPAVINETDAVPYISDNCTGCAACVRVCPMKCMKIIDNKVKINVKECIKCYCCHEFCPEKAIELR